MNSCMYEREDFVADLGWTDLADASLVTTQSQPWHPHETPENEGEHDCDPSDTASQQSSRAQTVCESYRSTTKVVHVGDRLIFDIPHKYTYTKKLGSGAYGVVVGFYDMTTKTEVAIKKVQDVFADIDDAKRVFRELRVLREMHHPNILRLIEILPPRSFSFRDVYMVTEKMYTDLHNVIYSSQAITPYGIKYMMKQVLHGLQYLHSRGVLHRDIKPSNLLINKDYCVKLCDFGLARGFYYNSGVESDPENFFYKSSSAKKHQGVFTDYVVTRWYRPPEILLKLKNYTTAIDVWSAGCVLGELMKRTALFKGDCRQDQLFKIISYCCLTSQEAPLRHHTLKTARNQIPQCICLKHMSDSASIIRDLRNIVNKRLTASVTFIKSPLFFKGDPQALDLLHKMLKFCPQCRISVDDALAHPFFAVGSPLTAQRSACKNRLVCARDQDVTVPSPSSGSQLKSEPFDWSFDNFELTQENLRSRMFQEMSYDHPEILSSEFLMQDLIGTTCPTSLVSSIAASPRHWDTGLNGPLELSQGPLIHGDLSSPTDQGDPPHQGSQLTLQESHQISDVPNRHSALHTKPRLTHSLSESDLLLSGHQSGQMCGLTKTKKSSHSFARLTEYFKQYFRRSTRQDHATMDSMEIGKSSPRS